MKKTTKIWIAIIAFIAISAGVFAATNSLTVLALNKTRSRVIVTYDTTATYKLNYPNYVNYTFVSTNQDTATYYLITQGKMKGLSQFVIVKRDTLTMAGTGAIPKIKNVVLRNYTTDYLYGFDEFRILIHSPAIEADDSLGTMKYYLQFSQRYQ
jgi:hypothetical protein